MDYCFSFEDFQDGKSNQICHRAFCNIAKVTKYTRLKIANTFREQKSLKSNELSYYEDQETKVNKRKMTKVSDEVFTMVEATLDRNNISLSKDELVSFMVPNSEAALKLNAWFSNYFDKVGDKIGDEIHLDISFKQEIFEEYNSNMKQWYGDKRSEILGYESFVRVWNICYPHVITRDPKASASKCVSCDKLATLRVTSSCYKERLRLSQLIAYHRHMFMTEKLLYHKRIMEAIMHPDEVMSAIMDGMDKEKTKLPKPSGVNLFYYIHLSNTFVNFRIVKSSHILFLSILLV